MKVSILIPVFNEEPTIRALIARVAQAELPQSISREIIVADDGSTDKTLEYLLELKSHGYPLNILPGKINRGKTDALMRCLEVATGDWVLFQDADLEYDPKHYVDLFAPVLSGKADIVLGSRFTGQIRSMNFWVRLGNVFNTWCVNLVYGSRLTDVNTCYKLIPRELISKLKMRSHSFGGDAELMGHFLRRKMRITEVPIKYIARPHSCGKKMNLRSSLHMFFCFFRVSHE